MRIFKNERQMAVLLVLSSVVLGLAVCALPVRNEGMRQMPGSMEEVSEQGRMYIEEAREELAAHAQVRLNALELEESHAEGPVLDSLRRERIRFWDMQMKPLASAVLVRELAEEKGDTAIWREAGLRFISAARMSEPEDRDWAYMEAERAFQKILEKNPDDPEANTNIGIVQIEMGIAPPMEGISRLREVVDKNPDYIPAILQLGHFSLLSGQISKARYWYGEAQQKAPGLSEINFYLGETYLAGGDSDSAMIFYNAYRETLKDPAAEAEFDLYLEDVLKHHKNH